jgi:hypothetical protein
LVQVACVCWSLHASIKVTNLQICTKINTEVEIHFTVFSNNIRVVQMKPIHGTATEYSQPQVIMWLVDDTAADGHQL